jgi:hypothetical protein
MGRDEMGPSERTRTGVRSLLAGPFRGVTSQDVVPPPITKTFLCEVGADVSKESV